MTEGHKAKFTPGCLPENHFAILFEGAWIFTPDPNSDGILAVCPLADDGMHAFEFGMWKDDALSPLQPFSTCFPNGAQFELTIDPDQIRCGGDSFHSIFDEAGRKYPFVYLSSTERRGKQSTKFRLRDDVKAKSRTVSIPLPTSVRAAGALISAEVRGPGTQELFGGVVSAKRTFVTFLFLYEYDDELDAVVEMEGGTPNAVRFMQIRISIHTSFSELDRPKWTDLILAQCSNGELSCPPHRKSPLTKCTPLWSSTNCARRS
jgi:hypothetical protein